MINIIIAVASMLGLTFLLSAFLVWANKKFHLEEDLRIERVSDMLPNNNCGACGFPGCHAFAEALVQKKVQPVQCTISNDETKKEIAHLIGVAVGEQEKQVARLACAGGSHVAHRQAHYTGLQSCRAASLISGGDKSCQWGCLGFGDCETVCDFDAIVMHEQGLPMVTEELCSACGDCVTVCPKDLFSLQPVSHYLWIACKNHQAGDNILADCKVACTACGRCAFDSTDELIIMHDNLAQIDYSKFSSDALRQSNKKAIQRCPTGAIIWIECDGIITKGAAAVSIIRKEELKVLTT